MSSDILDDPFGSSGAVGSSALDDNGQQWKEATAVEGLPSPFFYGEEQLSVHSEMPSDGMPSLVRGLVAAKSPARRKTVIRHALRTCGFDWLAYGALNGRGPRKLPRNCFTSYAHPSWTKRYFRDRHYEVDLRHQNAPLTGLPLAWDLDDLDRQCAESAESADATRERQFIQSFRDSGIGSGMTFKLPSPAATTDLTVISLSSRRRDRAWMDDAVLGKALTLGLCLHEFLACHAQCNQNGSDELRAGLSPLQQDILACLSEGEGDKQIAYRLQLSAHAVDYHMRQLRRRFAVRNRVQLVNATTG